MSLLSALSRLSLKHHPSKIPILRSRIRPESRFIHTTPCLLAEPLKKKKKMDPAIVRAREERKKKRVEKLIRRLEKHSRQLKPIEECEIPLVLIDNKKERMRNPVALSVDVLEQRVLLEKQWANYKREEHVRDMKMLDRIAFAQQRALDELRKESEELYQEAIQPDFRMIPFVSVGPVDTPAFEDYQTPDGDYQDVSKKWD